MKKYYNISVVAKKVGLKEHVIRYWDSLDPKTKKLRIDGISTKSKGGTRYFNSYNINKLIKLKHILYENGQQNYPLGLAKKLFSENKINKADEIKNNDFKSHFLDLDNTKKIDQILNKMRLLLKKNDIE